MGSCVFGNRGLGRGGLIYMAACWMSEHVALTCMSYMVVDDWQCFSVVVIIGVYGIGW